MTDLQREICKPVLKQDLRPMAKMESLSEQGFGAVDPWYRLPDEKKPAANKEQVKGTVLRDRFRKC